jgi:hypothetical protein
MTAQGMLRASALGLTQATEGQSMAQADHLDTTSRRKFLSITAAASVVSVGALAGAAMPLPASPCCFAADDSELLQLEKEILEQRRLAQAYDGNLVRLSEVWQAEYARLDDEFRAGRSVLTTSQRWDIVEATPESKEVERLTTLQHPHWQRHDEAVERMFALPARTAAGRGAKASALLALIAAFMEIDDNEGYPIDLVRKLLVELRDGVTA